ncbi:MAG: dihydropteroate synthase [Deltaproteobacteria bacterium]|nr:MAG: dihydropteroate synthase [Deltaproteobacteria bacterium]
MKSYKITWGKYSLELGVRTCIMGIVNVTPDSFSDGGKYFSIDTAVTHGERLFREGADILDIGGESTRPFSDPVSAREEIQRVVPVIRELVRRVPVPVSIDTQKAAVAREAINAGAGIVNDISALKADPGMADVVAQAGVPVVLMHMLGTPKTMQEAPAYRDLIPDITEFLAEAIAYAESRGIPREKIIIDPGIGFGKTVAHNLALIKNLAAFNALDTPLLIGPSRKAFIRSILKKEYTGTVDPDSRIAETGTQAAVAAAIMNGAHIVRVHNAADSRATAGIMDAIKTARSFRI